MKLFSHALELRAIRTIASMHDLSRGKLVDATSISSYLLSTLDEEFFHYPPCLAAFKRIQTIARKRAKIVSFEDLCEDPAIPEDLREVLALYEKPALKSLERAQQLVEGLDTYRKTRKLYQMSKAIIDQLRTDEVDVDKLLDTATNELTQIRSRENIQDMLLTIGEDANALDLIDEALAADDGQLYKTGITEFDERNGGIISEGVILLAGTTSGGKSVLRMTLCKNLYLLNKISVATASLEMNPRKETRRLLSNLTEIPFWKFVKKKLSPEDEQLCRLKWRKFHSFGKKNGAKYSILCPTRSVSIEQLLMLLKPYGFKVIAIDYITLLEGVDVDNQWRVLSNITRVCKIFSAETKCLVILLAQLDSEDERIRYSKGILEHVDNAWTWNYSKPEQRELHLIPIQQRKARDQELFNFDLGERFDIMTITDPTGDTRPQAPEEEPHDTKYDVS